MIRERLGSILNTACDQCDEDICTACAITSPDGCFDWCSEECRAAWEVVWALEVGGLPW